MPTVRVTAELDSDDFVNNCRGQGWRYASKASTEKVQMKPGEWSNPTSHYNFEGMYEGLCCFCASRMGNMMIREIGCYHCHQRDMLFREFSKLSASHKTAAGPVRMAPTWETHGWGALSDTLIDYILALALNNRYSNSGNVDRMLLDC